MPDLYEAQLRAADEQDRLRANDPNAGPVVAVEVLPQRVRVWCDDCAWKGDTGGDATHHAGQTGHTARVRTISMTVHTRQEG